MAESNPQPCEKQKTSSNSSSTSPSKSSASASFLQPNTKVTHDDLRKAISQSSTSSSSSSSSRPEQEHIPIPDRSHGRPQRRGMADPFEVRMRFTHQLQHLNASVTSAQKAAQYALKYKDMDEDLHSCILEQLERNSMNNRANIMYFLEHLADVAIREGHQDYVRMMQRDILRIVDAVAPEDGSGAANVKVVRKVLQGLQSKNHLLAQTVTEIEECLKERDNLPAHIGLSSPLADPFDNSHPSSTTTSNKKPSTNLADDLPLQPNQNGTTAHPPTSPNSTAPPTKTHRATSLTTPTTSTIHPKPLDKKQIEQRIEEDRERHKRLREHQWAIPFPTLPPGAPPSTWLEMEDPEFDKMWEETSSVASDDYRLFEEEYAERKRCSAEHAEEMEVVFGGQQQQQQAAGKEAGVPAAGGGGFGGQDRDRDRERERERPGRGDGEIRR